MTEQKLNVLIANAMFERIMTAAKNSTLDNLPLDVKAYGEKIEWCRAQARQHPSATDKTLVSLIKKEYDCDLQTAEKLWQHTRLFSSPEYRATKMFERERLTQMLRADLEKLNNVVEAYGHKDPMLIVECIKAKEKLVARIDSLNQYSKEEELKDVGAKNIVFRFTTDATVLPNVTPESMLALDAKVDKMIANKLRSQDIQEVDYVEIKK